MKPVNRNPVYKLLLLFLLIALSNICFSQIVYTNNYTTSRTFVNISAPSGGTFDPNDTIEVRYTIYLPQSPQPANGNGATQYRNILKSAQIVDTLPANVTYVANSLRILTNEGVLYKGPFTTAQDTDQGDTDIVGSNRIITIKARPSTGPALDTLHGGFWAFKSGNWTFQNNTSIPQWANSALCMITYRCKIGASYGQFVTFNKSSLWFKGIADVSIQPKYVYPRQVIAVYQSAGLCTDGIDLSGIFETNGSFGTGKPQNRVAASGIVPGGGLGYTFVANNSGSPVDGNYSIVNNSSALGSKDTTSNGGSAATRVFNVWDIFGDHTGSASTRYGNAPVDTAASKPGGGYMLLVNASYATNAAVTQTVNNVCKNTYYEFSAWFRNICPKCAGDSLSVSPGTTGYKTYPGNDSSGVRPNLAFEINDTLYYTSGDIVYPKNSSIPAWNKKGFVFLNTLDSFRITIRNNSPGGGGNDWAMDDVSVSTCGPSLKMNYSPYVLGCSDVGPQVITLRDTVRYSYNNSYVYYKWQRSINGGANWTDIALTSGGPALTTLVNGQYQYVTSYTFVANGATDSGYRYRVMVATSFSNLGNDACNFTDGTYTYLRLLKCGSTLVSELATFNGTLVDDQAKLLWTVNNESNIAMYEVERSDDGIHYYKIGERYGQNLSSVMYYSFKDNDKINGTSYFRLRILDNDKLYKYSNVVKLSTKAITFDIDYVNNPFTDRLRIDYYVPTDAQVIFQIFDFHGKLLNTKNMAAVKGFNSANINSLDGLAKGMYILKLTYQNNFVSRRVVKFN